MRNYRLLAAVLAVCGAAAAHAQPATAPVHERHVYFGDLHLHTVMSFDAWTFGTKVTPDQAYKFARGETVMVPASQMSEEGKNVAADVPAKRAWPLDFLAVTDHSEFMGAMHQLDDPNSDFSQTAFGKQVKAEGRAAFQHLGGLLHSRAPDDLMAAAKASHAWDVEMKAANDNYEPGVFTTFIAYEFTAGGGGVTLHRNVFFNSDHAPMPFSSHDSDNPEDLWTYLESVRKQGIDVIAIPHNANLSQGLAYNWNTFGSHQPMDEAYAQRRIMNEPLTEIVQNKGQSDTAPMISPNDEFANFELYERVEFGEGQAIEKHGGYVRDALGRGIVLQAKLGANPFKYGIEGATDIHNGLSTSEENAIAGSAFGIDPDTMLPTGEAARRTLGGGGQQNPQNMQRARRGLPARGGDMNSSGGLTGAWAEENTRDSIFAAFRRKETFATSGERIRLRMFGGWNFDPKMTEAPNWVQTAYASGVPMGADLPAKPAGNVAPKLALWAMKDPDGANLDRIQVIKLWLEGGDYKEKIFDVALSGGRKVDAAGKAPAVGNSVDLKTAVTGNNIGATELKTVWQDPEFDPAKPAVYYARILQIPTPRWTTYLAVRNNLPIPDGVAATIQERGWSSPVWYTPKM